MFLRMTGCLHLHLLCSASDIKRSWEKNSGLSGDVRAYNHCIFDKLPTIHVGLCNALTPDALANRPHDFPELICKSNLLHDIQVISFHIA